MLYVPLGGTVAMQADALPDRARTEGGNEQRHEDVHRKYFPLPGRPAHIHTYVHTKIDACKGVCRHTSMPPVAVANLQ